MLRIIYAWRLTTLSAFVYCTWFMEYVGRLSEPSVLIDQRIDQKFGDLSGVLWVAAEANKKHKPLPSIYFSLGRHCGVALSLYVYSWGRKGSMIPTKCEGEVSEPDTDLYFRNLQWEG